MQGLKCRRCGLFAQNAPKTAHPVAGRGPPFGLVNTQDRYRPATV